MSNKDFEIKNFETMFNNQTFGFADYKTLARIYAQIRSWGWFATHSIALGAVYFYGYMNGKRDERSKKKARVIGNE